MIFRIPLRKKNSIYALAFCCMLFCGREYDPFTDYSNAGLYLTHQSFKDFDTCNIFSTETLSAVVLVKELVDSCVIHSVDNRLWHASDSSVRKSDFPREPFQFYFSFSDTGWHAVRMTTYRSNGRTLADSIYFYVKSPLRQAALSCFFGDSIVLRTPPVRDRDVNYFWELCPSARYSSQLCSAKVVFSSAVLAGEGCVWVSDGLHASPPDSFAFSARDTSKPEIICVNENYVGKDTVYTGDSVFNFKVRISVAGDRWVDSASINGMAFDSKNDKVYYKIFDKMQLHDAKNPLMLSVFALDHFFNGNQSEKSFTVIFSDTVKPAAPARIVVLTPSQDTTVTMLAAYQISGTVENNSFDSLDLSLYAYVNNVQLSPVKIIKGAGNSWNWPTSLVSGLNAVKIYAKDNVSLNMVDSVSFSIIFTDTAHDTQPPKIMAIMANGLSAENFYTPAAAALLGVEAYDNGSGIDSLTIGGKRIMPKDSGMWYYDSINLQHTTSGNNIVIRVTDKKHNDTVASVILYQNRLPIVQKTPASAFIAMDSVYIDTLVAFDPDGDSLVFSKSAGPQALQVGGQGIVYWIPSQFDTGSHAVTIRVWDGYQPVFCSYTLYVYGDKGHPAPVKFGTRSEDFPQYLEVGKDTLRMALHVARNSGIRPFVFSSRIVNKNKTVLAEGPDSLITWAPALSDTGFEQLMVVVKDAFPNSDTIYPGILVVPPNRPCSLSITFSGDTTATGAIDLNKKRAKDTLVFHIIDPDNPLVERHDVSIVETRTQMRSIIDSAVVDSFVVVLDPLAFNGYDTLIAVVKDKAQHVDTLRQAVYYGMPPYGPQALDPLNYGSVNGPGVTLSWQDVDPDGDGLSYDMYFGASPDMMTLRATTAAASYLVSGLAAQSTYYWKITAKDWKSSTDGPIWQFTTR
ncbi:MAG: hypothetical protein WBM07_13860 [Chitinivibrionales bacterium]